MGKRSQAFESKDQVMDNRISKLVGRRAAGTYGHPNRKLKRDGHKGERRAAKRLTRNEAADNTEGRKRPWR